MKKLALKLFLLISFVGFTFKIASPLQESKDSIRIIVTTSGPAKFSSYWLDNPPRLVVKFQTRNIVSSIGGELVVNEGVIKRITSEYYGGTQKTLKSLTFELWEKVPYKIWQEENNIILDIQASLTAPLGSGEKEIFVKDESKGQIVKRLETMESALKQVSVAQIQNEPAKLIAESNLPQKKTTAPIAFWLMALLKGKQTIALWLMALLKGKQTIALWLMALLRGKQTIAFWLIGLTLISSVGLLVWLFWRRYRLILDKNLADCEIAKLKTQLQEQNTLLEHEQLIRKTVESTSLQKEKEFEQLKIELQTEKQLLEQEQKARKTTEEGLLQKEKEVREGEVWIAGKSEERREFPRLDLSKDYNRTIILRIESTDKLKNIKSFANNIGSGGLCFDTRHEFREKEKISIRLFFFGDKVPMMRIQVKIIWSKIDTPVNRYGISFTGLAEKDRTELSRYIESKIPK